MATYLVSRFESAVVVTLLLNGIVSQMDHAVCRVFQVVFTATGPQIPVSVPVGLQVSVNGGAEGVATDVKLAILVQERLLDVFLNNVTTPMSIDLLCLNQTLDVVEVTADLDATAAIGVLTRLDNP